MTEKEWMRQVIELARLYGWIVVHFLPAVVKSGKKWLTPYQGDGKGWPDLFLIHAGWRRIAVAELKTERGRVAAEQKRWLELFTACGVETFVWRPSDWDAIAAFLSSGSAEGTPGPPGGEDTTRAQEIRRNQSRRGSV